MMSIKLIAMDLDGTLFTDQKEVTRRNQQALKKAREKGVHVVVTTGRPLKAIEYLLEELDLMTKDSYSITFNGGLVQNNQGEILDKKEMSYLEARRIVETAGAMGLPLDILSDAHVYEYNPDGLHSLYQAVNPHLVFHKLECIEDLPKDIVLNKVLSAYDARVLDEKLPVLQDLLGQHVEVFKSRDIVLEFMPKGVHKAAGLAHLCQHLEISPKEVLAIGDEENDLTMIEWAGLGVAMKNGVPALKEKADVVTPHTNNDSGLAWAVEKFILGEEHGII